ncbi:MAG: glycogen-binding domain-containing protein [Kiritimatiellae bacterium]|nr:glycogen-binding domain-containing protein [Kiritimatiellia bacterium]
MAVKRTRKAGPRKAAAVKNVAPKAPSRKRVLFSVAAEPGSKVAVSGDFNNWDTVGHPMVDKSGDGNYTASILLAPGVYEYKFIVNDTWSIDPNCVEWVQNSFGTLNSVLRV